MSHTADIDMIAFTFQVPEERREQTKKNLYRFRTPSKRKKLRSDNNTSRYGNGFHETYTGSKIAVYPINKSHNFMRVEFNSNPDKEGDGVKKPTKKVVWILEITVGEDVHQLIRDKSRVARLDLCITLRKRLPNCYIYLSKARSSEILTGDDGEEETQYAGAKDSDLRAKLYDKEKERLAKGLPSRGPEQRLEIQIRNLNVSLAELDDTVAQQFQKVSFYSADLLADKKLSKKFRNQVKKYSLNAAMAELMAQTRDRDLKRRYETVLRKYKIDPFNIEDVDIKVNWKPLEPLLKHQKK